MSNTSRRLTEHSPKKKRELLAQLLQNKATQSQRFPLSFAQQRLWFLDQLQPGLSAYNIATALRITGSLNIPALEQSLNEIVRRHEVLRTTFTTVNNQPFQCIAPSLTLTLPLVDLRQLPPDEREVEVRRRANEEAQYPFNLAGDPLLRATILKLDTEDYVVLFTMHHIISDGWSMGVLIQEVAALYEAFCVGKPSPLPELPIQYADFAVWQREWLQGQVMETELAYWQQQLGNPPSLLQLPTDYPRPAIQTGQGATQSFCLSPNLTEALKALSRQENVTLFMTLLAAFMTLLHRYTGQDDILVGSPIANRNRAEVEGIIGFFVNTLVLRNHLCGNLSFRELLSQVREVCLGAYAHQNLPFEKLVEALNLERNLSHNPLFQVMFALQNAPQEDLAISGLTVSPLRVETGTAQFDLSLTIVETEQGLIGSLNYSTDLFESATITRMVGHFQTLLESIVANPNQGLGKIGLLTAKEQQQLLVEWNDTHTDYPKDQCIHQLFEVQVERTPDAVAVVCKDQPLTYRELNARANQLAHYLQRLGVKPEVLVGICVERSLEMVVGLLGILKAGGAYVPLDPSYPQERLSYTLADSGVEVLLTQQSLLESLPEHQARVVCLDTDWGAIEQHSQENLDAGVDSDNLAYVIYTSGSTGQPKGVQICHHSVVNFLNSMSHFPGLAQEDTFYAVTTISFDIAALELYLPLTVGAKVVVASREIASNPDLLLSELFSSKITVMQATPATWQMLLAGGWSSSYPLKVLCGGEALSAQLAHQILETGSELWNLYGPTEATIWSTIYQVGAKKKVATTKDALSSIGRPIANTQIYILDKHLQPVPLGVAGELYIGGDGLARGYLNRPELTQEKFIPNPFDNSLSERLYKTGDLARYLSDSKIEFLGRIDHQVKIRGFRIELGEIEAVLNTHPQIQQAVVIATEDTAGNKGLVAYLVTRDESLTSKQLREFLFSKLPEYMVPSAFVTLDTLPLTPNGKVDRKALPAPDGDFPREHEYVAPRNQSEERIANIFASVLSLQNVGIYDNFFEQGGHSLLATQLISRLRNVFQIELPLRKIFEYPTVAALAEAIQAMKQSQQRLNAPPIVPVPRDQNLPLSFAQERLWFLEQLEPNNTTYNNPSSVRLTGFLNIRALEQSLNEIVRRHEVLRTTFTTVNRQPVQVITPTLTLKLPVVNLQELPETERETEVLRLAVQEADQPFDLAKDILLRVKLLKLGETEHVVLLTMHHIVTDAWSTGILIRELSTLYQAFCSEKSDLRQAILPELSVQYADFAHWQRQWLQGEVLDNQLSYWQKQLAGAPTKLDLQKITGKPPLTTQTQESATQSFQLSTNLSEKLRKLSSHEGVTLFMTLLAAFQTLLYRYTNQDDIVVGTDVANRNRAEIEPLIGFFVNILVLRSDLSGNPTFRELLERVREVTLGAYAHQDLPFAKLVESLQPDRAVSKTPLFQVLFVLQNAPMPAVEFSGLTLTPIEINSNKARFDLALFMEETEQGLVGNWKYRTDLFEAEAITLLSAHFQTLLHSIAQHPDTRINALEMLSESEKQQQIAETNQREKAQFKKFKTIKPKTVSLPQKELIKIGYLQPEQNLPYVIQTDGDDIDLADWATNKREFIETNLLQHGAILFRGFNVKSVLEFEKVASAICPKLFGEYGDLPREGISGRVYGSTPYPSDQAILFHNESSHMHQWPLKIWFFCVHPAQEGGETPIVDCRKVYQRLNPKLRERFEQKQLMYVRNYIEGLDVSWQDFFHTTDKIAVENYCHQSGIDFEWLPGNGLRIRQVRPAISQHPKTGESLFFNQVQLHHISCLKLAVKASLLSMLGEENLPRNVYYGDGSPIEDSIMAEIGEVYQEAKVSFPWQQGDILMLDNMLIAHGRSPYVGSRKIVVAMGEMISRKNI
ncbi:amino acid adenylation domain-containing protein [Coleofasciculus sp.]|uniref:amino acid adenylation domain-containing protein n=1 Tax=Coleofasciculus sp. TaxID=3100458 RepID=UPI003A13D5F6